MTRPYPAAPARSILSLPGTSAPVLVKLAAILVGTGLLTASSWIRVPMVPVPITLQILVVLLVGAGLGARLGMLTVVLWIAEGVAGLPVFAGGGFGLATLAGPTGGYILSFAVVAGLVGWCSDEGLLGTSIVWTFALLLLSTIPISVLGWAGLARLIGPESAWAAGVLPFLLGDLLKVTLATAIIEATGRGFKTRFV